MPCYDSRTSPEYIRGEVSAEYEHKLRTATTRANRAEALLCGVLSALTDHYDVSVRNNVNISNYWDAGKCGLRFADLVAWWDKHQEEDRRKGKRK